MNNSPFIKQVASYFSLFGSLTTLFCCALPILFVSIGMGAVFASITATIPQINILVEHKNILFAVTGILLILSYTLMTRSQPQECPIDPSLQKACQTSKPLTKKIFWFSVAIYTTGALFSYILPSILYG